MGNSSRVQKFTVSFTAPYYREAHLHLTGEHHRDVPPSAPVGRQVRIGNMPDQDPAAPHYSHVVRSDVPNRHLALARTRNCMLSVHPHC